LSLRDEIDPAPLAMGALLIAALAVQLAWPTPAPVARNTGRVVLPASVAADRLPVDYPQVLARPLFTPSRGAAGDAAAAQSAAAALSDYTLAGVARVGGRGEAIFRTASGETISLHTGEALLGWRLAAIEPGGVILQQGELSRAVKVSASAGPKTGAQ
jgi:hypothetical protein